jgi:hypothetical protein
MSYPENLVIWTIYEKPADYPDSFVARKFIADLPTSQMIIASTLERVRKAVQQMTDYDLVRVERSENDAPHIVECWL